MNTANRIDSTNSLKQCFPKEKDRSGKPSHSCPLQQAVFRACLPPNPQAVWELGTVPRNMVGLCEKRANPCCGSGCLLQSPLVFGWGDTRNQTQGLTHDVAFPRVTPQSYNLLEQIPQTSVSFHHLDEHFSGDPQGPKTASVSNKPLSDK